MYKNLLVLPDGTEISSGSGTKNAIKNIKSTQMVNSGEELTIGSACSNMIEATLFTPGGDLNITAGQELTHYKVDVAGNRKKVGLFTVEQPTRPTPNTMKIVGYDRISKLDKDMTKWLDSLDGWPYTVNVFASMVCRACGLNYVEQSGLPNADFPIRQWKKSGATGRQIMRWLGEIVCRFAYADPDGNILFGWYKNSGKSYTPDGENYFFAGSLTYENYQVAPVQAAQIRLADNDSGAVWPMLPDGTNSYIITGNPILTAYVTEDLLPYLDVIAGELAQVTYTPCEVAVRAALDVNAGDIIHIADKNGKTFSTYVMSKITSGQRDTLSSTGSRRRDSTSAANNKSESEKMAETEAVANSAQNAANSAQKDANEKKRVFVSQPVPPYDVGDLWAQGSTGDLMRCKTARDSGSYSVSDWELASKYIDAATAGNIAQEKTNALDRLLNQTGVFNRLTNNGAAQGLFMDNGDVYINASYIKSGILLANLIQTGVLQSKDGKSFYLDLDSGVLKGKFDELSISGKTVDTIAQEKANAAEGNAKTYADTAASNAVSAQTQTDIFNKLTNNGAMPGLFMRDGQMYINADYLVTGILRSKNGDTFYLDLDNGVLKGKFQELSISGKTVDTIAQEKANTAESNAKSHANTVAGTAERNAKSYASSVAGTAESNAKSYANQAAANAVAAQTQLDIFNKLTNNGATQGIYLKDGKLYLNASYMQTGGLSAALITAGILLSANKKSRFDLDQGLFSTETELSGKTVQMNLSGASMNLRLKTSGSEFADILDISSAVVDGKYKTLITDGNSYTPGNAFAQPGLIINGRGGLHLGSTYGDVNISGQNVSVKPGKTTLFTGSCAVGGSCTVDNTAKYDLFAVFLGNGSTMEETAVLCYKHGSSVRGIGGRANTLDENKEIHFFEATISGNTWTVVDCGYNNAYAGGGFSDSHRLRLMKVVGVI